MAQGAKQLPLKPDDPSSNPQINPHKHWKQKYMVCDASTLRAKMEAETGDPWNSLDQISLENAGVSDRRP